MPIFRAQKWEAPDRKFIGHRDCLVRNMSRYDFIAGRAKGRCLDIGCGRGYGFDYLRPNCTSCTGLDTSEEFIREARQQFPEIAFVHHDAEKLPFDDASFDTITSFEVIEHIEDDSAFLREIARVAAPNAVVAISTPNRAVASPGQEKPLNKFHVREYLPDQFRNLLTSHFDEVMFYGQSDSRGDDSPSNGLANSLLDRIPVRLKYLIPYYVQDLVSVMVRSPLKREDCHFKANEFAGAHTLYGVGRVSDK